MFGMSFAEIGIILLIALLLLGPDKLPEVAKMLGKGIREGRKYANMFQNMLVMEADRADLKERITSQQQDYQSQADDYSSQSHPMDQDIGIDDSFYEEDFDAHSDYIHQTMYRRKVELSPAAKPNGSSKTAALAAPKPREETAEYYSVHLHEQIASRPPA